MGLVRSTLKENNLSLEFLGKTINKYVYALNRSSKNEMKRETPYEKWSGK